MTLPRRLSNLIKSWAVCESLVFCLALFVYALTLRPDIALWDSGEFVCAAAGLDVGHPPGAPLYWLVLRLFSMLFPAGCEALACNVVSALTCAAAAAFLCRCVRMLLSLYVASLSSLARDVAGVCAGLTWAVTGSVWAVAVETEVYGAAALISFFTLWCALRWRTGGGSFRFLALLAFSVGLTSGVHWLGWLLLPVSFVVIGSAWSRRGMLIGLLVGCLAVPMLVFMASGHVFDAAVLVDELCVNVLRMPVMVGWGIAVVLALSLLLFVAAKSTGLLSRAALMAFLVLIGFTPYALPMLRSASGVPLAVSSPSDPVRLTDYMARRQYASRPLLYGPTYASVPYGIEHEARMDYDADSKTYLPRDVRVRYDYPSDQKSIFPRMTERDEAAMWAYRQWANPDGWPDSIPSFASNVRFFLRYQVGHMMLRYVLWNFSGRQNGALGDGGYDAGNAITGIPVLDRHTLGLVDYDEPSSGRVSLFAIPLILSVIGFCLLARKGRRKMLFALGVWILICGPALALYVNMPPFEPRERDYIFLPLYAAFAIGVGVSVAFLFEFVARKLSRFRRLIAVVFSLAVPSLMAVQAWASSSRHSDTIPTRLATSILNLCPPDAIIVTGGDNDTYPLWYAQQVLAHRCDIRVVNYSLLNASWHLASLVRSGRADAPLTIPHAHLALADSLSAIYLLPGDGDTLSLSDVHKVDLFQGYSDFCIPSYHIRIPLADTSVVISPKSAVLSPNALLLLEIMAFNPSRPLCLMPGAVTDSLGLEPFLQDVGPLAYLTAKPSADVRPLFRAFSLPDADRFSPTDDEVAQLSRLSIRRFCLDAANAYVANSDGKSALRALRSSLSWQPAACSPSDTTLLSTALLLCRLGDTQLCRQTLSVVADYCSLRLRWAANIEPNAPVAARRMRDTVTPLLLDLITTLRQTGNADIATALADIAEATTNSTTP